MSNVSRIEQALCRATGRRFAVLVGNGTAGLSLCLQALGAAGRPVVLPDAVCINVPLALVYAGALPVYAEVGLADLGLDASRLAPALTGAAALVAVHGHGSICDLPALQARADAAGCPLIEDACLAFGGRLGPAAGDRPAGSFGLASVLSFGAGKPLTLEHGGAVLTDDAPLARALRALDAALPTFSAEAQRHIDDLGRSHTRLYNAHFGVDLAAQVPAFRQLAMGARASVLHRYDPARAPALWRALPTLGERVAQRWQHLEALHQQLSPWLGEGLRWLPPTPGAVPWRCNLLVEGEGPAGHDARHRLMRALHAAGLHASSWHPPASAFLADQPARHPVAERIGDQILNLWLDETCTPAYRAAVQRVIAEHRPVFA